MTDEAIRGLAEEAANWTPSGYAAQEFAKTHPGFDGRTDKAPRASLEGG